MSPGATDRDRTDDLFLTKEVLYQLSYSSIAIVIAIYTKPTFTYDGKSSLTQKTEPSPLTWYEPPEA